MRFEFLDCTIRATVVTPYSELSFDHAANPEQPWRSGEGNGEHFLVNALTIKMDFLTMGPEPDPFEKGEERLCDNCFCLLCPSPPGKNHARKLSLFLGRVSQDKAVHR